MLFPFVLQFHDGTEYFIKTPINRLYPPEYDKRDEDVDICFFDDANIKIAQKTDIQLQTNV